VYPMMCLIASDVFLMGCSSLNHGYGIGRRGCSLFNTQFRAHHPAAQPTHDDHISHNQDALQ
jgi:hypothetical protein